MQLLITIVEREWEACVCVSINTHSVMLPFKADLCPPLNIGEDVTLTLAVTMYNTLSAML